MAESDDEVGLVDVKVIKIKRLSFSVSLKVASINKVKDSFANKILPSLISSKNAQVLTP